MAELSDSESAFAYCDSILLGERVRLRGLRNDDLPSLGQIGDGSRPDGDDVELGRPAV